MGMCGGEKKKPDMFDIGEEKGCAVLMRFGNASQSPRGLGEHGVKGVWRTGRVFDFRDEIDI